MRPIPFIISREPWPKKAAKAAPAAFRYRSMTWLRGLPAPVFPLMTRYMQDVTISLLAAEMVSRLRFSPTQTWVYLPVIGILGMGKFQQNRGPFMCTILQGH